MQLKSSGRIRQALAVATYSLLAGHTSGAHGAQNELMDLTGLHYAETGRVTVDEQVFALKRDKKNDKSFTLKLFHDSITGATPNGAADPSTFTSPSGLPYTTTLAQIVDERYAVSGEWEKEKSRLEKLNYSLSYSSELDYDSLGGSWQTRRDSKDRMRTYTHGYSVNYDLVRAEGGIPVPLAPVSDTTRTDSATKLVADYMYGITQVVSRSSVLQLNASLGYATGYLTDPYKVFTVDGAAPYALQYESRPGQRVSGSLYARLIKRLKGGDVINSSFRFYADNWGINSQTVDFRYRYHMSGKWYTQPHIRYYVQSAAYFYGYKQYKDTVVTDYASGDYRLGNLSSLTTGVQLGREFSRKMDANFRVEYLLQTDRLNQFEPLEALIVQLSFRYRF